MTRCTAGHLLYKGDCLEPEGSAHQEVDALLAVTVVDLVLAVQPVIELEEERQVRLRLRTEDLFSVAFYF